jgi:hypothetical protein
MATTPASPAAQGWTEGDRAGRDDGSEMVIFDPGPGIRPVPAVELADLMLDGTLVRGEPP